MPQKGIPELQADVVRLETRLAEVTAQKEAAERALHTAKTLNEKRVADNSAQELAQYVYDRMPGLRVSQSLGGPTISTPTLVNFAECSCVLMTIETTDGRVYGIEVYRAGEPDHEQTV